MSSGASSVIHPTGLIYGHSECRYLDETIPVLTQVLALELVERRDEGESVVMRFAYPHDLARYVVLKGSVAISGISLTVSALGDDWLEVALIPTTLRETTLGAMAPGARVNVETDMLAKYVERLLLVDAAQAPQRPPLSVESLKAMGY